MTPLHNDGKADKWASSSLMQRTNEEVWTIVTGTTPKRFRTSDSDVHQLAAKHVDLTQIDKIHLRSMGWYILMMTSMSRGCKTNLLVGLQKPDTFYSDYQADVSLAPISSCGLRSWQPAPAANGMPLAPTRPAPIDISKANKLCFWIYDTTANNDGKADNSVGVKLFDAAGTNEEVWTDSELAGTNPKTVQNEWTQMCINLAAYSTVDLTQIDKIQFALYWDGTYYIDDITLE